MGHPKPSVCRALQSGGWQAPQRVTDGPKTSWAVTYPSQSLFLSPAWPPALGSPTKDEVCIVSACLPVSPPPRCPPGAFCFQGHLWPPFLRCVRARGLKSLCLAQIHILFLSLCNNQCSWWSRAELGPGREAGATSSWKPSAWPCCCDYHTPSCCTVSMV